MTSTTTNDRAAAGSTAAPFPPCRMSRALITNWWMLALRGLLGVIFGPRQGQQWGLLAFQGLASLAVLVFPAGTMVLLFSALCAG
jgi:hypothetical protein